VTRRYRDPRLWTLTLAAVVVASTGFPRTSAARAGRAGQDAGRAITVSPIPFAERNTANGDVYNASGIVPLADSRFLVCDNNTNHALIRLQLTADGRQAEPLVLLPLTGLDSAAVDDMEDIAMAQEGDRWFIFSTPSLSMKGGSKKKKGAQPTARPSGLVRITVSGDRSYVAEAMPDFRAWLISRVAVLAAAADKAPDAGGLNVEGLAWDAARRALLFGVRTPVHDGAPIVVPVRVKDVGGPWAASNLEALEPIRLQVEPSRGSQGIRAMSPGPDGRGFLVVVGNATSGDPSPFALYSWDGNDRGVVRRLPVTFQRGMKPEGVTVGTVGGKPSVVFVDDGGGFQVVRLDEIQAAGTGPSSG
jgi:hypothetical protein